jgi:putative ABC transport system ATP-binding protein
MAEEQPIIELKKVTRLYNLGGEPIYALNNVNFKVGQGEYVSITGPSGSGKSTLVNVISGLDTPTKGSVIVGGKELSGMRDDALSVYRNQTIGFIFQSFHLQPAYTILDNVMLPLILQGVSLHERKKRATEYLQMVGLDKRMDHKPSELSSGQQQLAAIARALVVHPKIIIADEPTGNLDSARTFEIFQLLQKINDQGTTLVVITHDPNMAHLADRIAQMSDGKLTELKA